MRRITRNNVELIQKTITEKLAGAERDLGVSIIVGLTTFTPHYAIFRLETAIVGEDGEIKARKLIVSNPENESFMVVDRDTGEIIDTGYKTVADAAVSWPNVVNAPGVEQKAP